MFGFKERSYGTFEDADSLKNLSDDVLLDQYKEHQRAVKSSIGHRNHPDQFELHDETGEPVSREEKQEITQNFIEKDFGVLGRLRAEIERRGLEVPTLEEQEKRKN